MIADTPSNPASDRSERRHRARRQVAAAGSAAALVTSFGALALGGGTAGAAALTVDNCDDSGTGSLRQAILDANADLTDADTITITTTCSGASAVPVASVMTINGDTTIVGPGAADFVLDGGGTSGIIEIDDQYGYDPPSVTITGITFTDAGGNDAALSATNFDAVVIDGVVFHDNHHTYDGGAVAIQSGSSLTISSTTFSDNSSGGDAGALDLVTDATTVITDSLFAGNTSYSNGGAIRFYEVEGEQTIANCTFSGNAATAGNGGAVYAESLYVDANFLFVTVADNTAYGDTGGFFFYYAQYDVTLQGTVFTGNSGHQLNFYSVGGSVVTDHNDFHGTVSGFTPDATDVNVDPQIGALADNGGPTLTRALAATSPVLDLGPTAWTSFPGDAYDQRGTPYARVANGRADMGAFELPPAAPPPDPTPEPTPEPSFTG